jgi:uncharacterized OsmC-like protein
MRISCPSRSFATRGRTFPDHFLKCRKDWQDVSDQHTITAQTTKEAGRYLIEGPGKVFVSDSAMIRGVPSVAPGPIELLVSALGSCTLASVESDPRDLGIAITGATANVTSIRDENDDTRFKSIQVDIVVSGVTQEVADRLIEHFVGHCPIFNTIRRGGPIAVSVTAAP